MKKHEYIPEGYHAVTLSLTVRDIVSAMEWYNRALGAKEVMRLVEPTSGSVVHAAIQLLDSVILLSEENPNIHNKSAETLHDTPVALHLYVMNCDEVVKQAVDAGAEVIFSVSDQFYGDRAGRIRDPFGYLWVIATRKENISPEEIQRRWNEMLPATV